MKHTPAEPGHVGFLPSAVPSPSYPERKLTIASLSREKAHHDCVKRFVKRWIGPSSLGKTGDSPSPNTSLGSHWGLEGLGGLLNKRPLRPYEFRARPANPEADL